MTPSSQGKSVPRRLFSNVREYMPLNAPPAVVGGSRRGMQRTCLLYWLKMQRQEVRFSRSHTTIPHTFSVETAKQRKEHPDKMWRLLLLAAVVSRAKAVDVGSCSEFAAVDRKVVTEVTITSSDFSCDEYTRLAIRTDMVLKSSVGKVSFNNFALKVYGSLTVEPDVSFTGVTLAVR